MKLMGEVWKKAAAFAMACLITGASVMQGDLPAQAVENPAGITGQPVSETVAYGETAVFSVTAEEGVSFQWQEKAPGAGDFTDLPGEIYSMLTVETPSVDQTGASYRCEVQFSDGREPQFSSEAVLTVEQREVSPVLAGGPGEDGGLKLQAFLPADAQGSVTFYQNGAPVGEGVTLQDGTASYTMEAEALPEEEAVFTASYSGDANTKPADSFGSYSFTPGQEFSQIPAPEVPDTLVYGETIPLELSEGEIRTSDPSVLLWEKNQLTALKPGTAFVAVTGGEEGKNPSTAVFTVNVQKRSVKAENTAVLDKEYDGTTAAQLAQTPSLAAESLTPGDEGAVTLLWGTPAFQSKDAGNGIPVALPMSLGGKKAGCYQLETEAVSGDIKKRPLTVTFRQEAYRGQEKDLDALIGYSGFIPGETAESLEQTGEFTPGSVQIDWDNGEKQDSPLENTEVFSYPAAVTGVSAKNYEIQMEEDACYQEITYLGQENQDFVLEYRSITVGGMVWILGEITVSVKEGSGYTLISKTEDFSGGSASCTFSRKEIKKGTISFYLKKGDYDPNSTQNPNDTGAVAKVTGFPVPQSDFDAPEISGLTYQMKNGEKSVIDASTSPEELADIERFYRDTVTVSFTAQDRDSGLKNILCEWIDEDSVQSKNFDIASAHTEEKQIAFEVAPPV